MILGCKSHQNKCLCLLSLALKQRENKSGNRKEKRLFCRQEARSCLPLKSVFKPLTHHVDMFNKIQGISKNLLLGVRVFANGPGDRGSIPGRVTPKTFKMLLDTSLVYISMSAHTHTHTHTQGERVRVSEELPQQYTVCVKGQVEQSMERSSALPYTSV